MNGIVEPKKKSTALLLLLFAFLGLSLILVNHLENRLLSSSRAFVTGQVFWVKAQKEASLSLARYIITQEESDYSTFVSYLDVIDGDRIAREEIYAENTDYSVVESGFLRGNNPPENIPHLIWLLENFSTFKLISDAIDAWVEGEILIDSMESLAVEARNKIQSGQIDDEARGEIIHRIFELDERLSELEFRFAAKVNEASNWVSSRTYWLNMLVIIILTIGLALIVMMYIREMRLWHEKTQQSEKRFREVLSNSRDVIYQLDIETGKYVYISPSIKNIIGYEVEELLDGGVSFVLSLTHPEDRERMENEVIDYGEKDVDAKLNKDSQFRIKRKDGEYIWINNRRSLMKDENGNPVSIIGNVRDISERKKYIEALDKSLKDKELLLSEIHHRVKNNLSIVSSLVELQKNKSKNVSGIEFKEIQSRIKSIALVHEKLYENETFEDVNLAEYIDDLVKMLKTAFESSEQEITIQKDLDSVIVDIKKAVPLGLICNELINNSLKYAFEGRTKGTIFVKLKSDNDMATFSISDDGVGLPDKFEEKRKDSLGMTLVQVLTRQLEGTLDYSSSDKGARFSVEFQAAKTNT